MLKSHETVYDANIKSNRSTKLEKKNILQPIETESFMLNCREEGSNKTHQGGELSRFPKMEDFKIIKIFR